MTVLVIRHRVQDYGRWKALFDEDAEVRQAHGSRSERVFHDIADADEVLIYLEWDDAERARLFARSDELRDAMVDSGVTDRPDVWILKEVDRTAF
jgi:heme-degrading monooxygenase HmoA